MRGLLFKTTRMRSSRELPSGASGRTERILEEYGVWLRRTLNRLCPRELSLDVEDVYQEVTIKLWKILKSEKEIEHLPSYLYRVASTATIDAVRHAMAKRESELLNGQGRAFDGAASPESSPERLVEDALLADTVREVIAGLPANRRRAVALHLQGFETPEVAALLGWREPKARNLVYRGLRDLREELRRRGVGVGVGVGAGG